MSRDLRELLRDTAATPSEPVVPTDLIERARWRRRRRHVVAGSLPLAAAVVVTGVILGGGTDRQSLEVTDRPPGTAEPAPGADDDTNGVADPQDGVADHPGGVGDAPATVALSEVEWPLLVLGREGARQQAQGGIERSLTSDPVVAVHPDLRGGAVLQGAEDGGAITWLRAGDETPTDLGISTESAVPTLRAVVERDGEPTVLFTRRVGEGENETETLHGYGLASGEARELGVTGRMESGLGGVGVVDDRLVYTGCHLHCTLFVVPQGSTTEADDVVQLFPQAQPIQGLDVVDGVAAYVEAPMAPDGGEGAVDLRLWLHDLDRDDRRQIPLPRPDTPVGHGTVSVDIAPGGTAALVSFRGPGTTNGARTLVIDRLDEREPRLRWLDSDQHVRFDAPDT